MPRLLYGWRTCAADHSSRLPGMWACGHWSALLHYCPTDQRNTSLKQLSKCMATRCLVGRLAPHLSCHRNMPNGDGRMLFSLADYDKKKYVWKLLYIYMLGYPVEFGHKQASDLIAAGK